MLSSTASALGQSSPAQLPASWLTGACALGLALPSPPRPDQRQLHLSPVGAGSGAGSQVRRAPQGVSGRIMAAHH